MEFIQVNNINLNLNLKREYKLIQCSDIHAISLDPNQEKERFEEANRNENNWFNVKESFAHHFKEKFDKDTYTIPSLDCFRKIIDFVNNEKPDAMLLTGDIIDYYSIANYKALEDYIKDIKVPYIFTCGNHEQPVSNFKSITNGDPTFMLLEFDEFQIIGLDDSTKKITKEQIIKLNKALENNKKTIICIHIPFMTKDNEKEMEIYDPYFVIDYKNTDEPTKEFIDILCNNPLIKYVFCGHCHGMSKNTFAKNKEMFICSSGLIGMVHNITIR